MPITIASLEIYPLKSGRAQSVETAWLTPDGLLGDRQWMVVRGAGDKEGSAITPRDPGGARLALVDTKLTSPGAVVFTAPGVAPLTIDARRVPGATAQVQVRDDACPGADAGSAAAAWFSNYLGQSCRLVKTIGGRAGGFAENKDALVVTSLPSFEALRRCFTEQADIGMESLRPNIVLTGNAAFEEDSIATVLIGNETTISFRQPCPRRCTTPTFNGAAQPVALREPLATLLRVRSGAGGGLAGAFFGQSAVPETFGIIHVGDTVQITARRTPHPVHENMELRF